MRKTREVTGGDGTSALMTKNYLHRLLQHKEFVRDDLLVEKNAIKFFLIEIIYLRIFHKYQVQTTLAIVNHLLSLITTEMAR